MSFWFATKTYLKILGSIFVIAGIPIVISAILSNREIEIMFLPFLALYIIFGFPVSLFIIHRAIKRNATVEAKNPSLQQ